MKKPILITGHNRSNSLLLGVLIAGSLFIGMTRVRSSQIGNTPARAAESGVSAAPQPDHPAPDFTLASLDGSSVTLSELKGRVVLINIWATWCPPCRAEMPVIQSAYERYRDQGFTVLAVDLQEDPATVDAFMRRYGLTFPALLDRDGKVSVTYRSSALPSSYFVDHTGVIRAVYRGPMPRSVLTGTVEQLLAEPAKE
jgi:cytochrome c biogenesis protein CcmG, thiol:disulfide interchange protein DsbE